MPFVALQRFASHAVTSVQWLVARKLLRPRALPLPLLAAVFLLSLATSHSPLFAQTGLATLSGTVTDPSGALITNALITVTNQDTGVSQKTNTTRAGVYVVEALNPGKYRVVVEHQGFKQIEVLDLELHTQDVISRNFTLPVGAASEVIQVNGNQQDIEQDPAVSLVVDRDFVENMPLNGRSFQDLISLTPGATQPGISGLFSFNGQRDYANNFSVDGVSANLGAGIPSPSSADPGSNGLAGDIPSSTIGGTTQSIVSVEELQEFRVQTSGYTAEYGRQPGGQLQFTTRSGTNDFHGALFENLRNTAFDANSYQDNANDIPRQAERQNDFGGTFGGPVRIPYVYNGKDKTFFFVSYEHLQLLLPNFEQSYVPTAAMRQAAAPSVETFLNAFPLPNGPMNTADGCTVTGLSDGASCDAQLNVGSSYPQKLDAVGVRLDHSVGEKVQVFGRFSRTPSSQSSAGTSNPESYNALTGTWTAGATARASSNITNDARINLSSSEHYQSYSLTNYGGALPFSEGLVMPPQFVGGDDTVSLGFNLPGTACCGGFVIAPQQSSATQHQLQIVDGLSWVHGAHSFKFGADWRQLRPHFASYQYDGVFRFSSLQALQGGSDTTTELLAKLPAHPVLNNLSLYAQDHWKLGSRLTLDYGLRWELNPPPSASNGIYPVTVTQITDLATMQLAPAGTPQYHTRYDNFAPRLGFAYNLRPGGHATTLRGGGGIFYDTGQNLGLTGYTNAPFQTIEYLGSVMASAIPTLTPPAINLTPSQPYILWGLCDPNLRLPYTYQWNLSVDQALAPKNTLTLSYVGNLGRRLLFQQLYYASTVVNPEFLEIFLTTNAAASGYNALQIQDQGQVAPGMRLIASYTWSHARDNVSSASSDFPPEWGNSDGDLRQVVNLALNYSIPGSSATNKLVRRLSQGWMLSGLFTARTGPTFNVSQGSYTDPVSGDGIQINADIVPNVPIFLRGVPGVLRGIELNQAAFSYVPVDPTTGNPLQPSNQERNYFYGPGFWNLNSSLQRAFKITENSSLTFRADAFNILNHPNLQQFQSDLEYPDFGQLNPDISTVGVPNALYATGAARSLQLSLRLQF
jgi:hypothetical protein